MHNDTIFYSAIYEEWTAVNITTFWGAKLGLSVYTHTGNQYKKGEIGYSQKSFDTHPPKHFLVLFLLLFHQYH